MMRKFFAKIYSLHFLFLLRLMFGNYCNISKSNRIQYIVRLYCICVTAIPSMIYFNIQVNYYSCAIVEYTCHSIISFFVSEAPFFEFYTNIKTGDSLMGFKNIPIPLYIHFVIFGVVLARVSTAVMRLYMGVPSIFTFMCVLVSTTAMDLNQIVIAIVFAVLHKRMQMLRVCLEKQDLILTYRNDTLHTVVKIKTIRKILYNYDMLLNNMLILDLQLQCLVIILFVDIAGH